MTPVVLPSIPATPPTQVPAPPGNVAGFRYGHQTSPWDSPLSFGVQAFIEYNGYILNDRYQADCIRVINITGLDDADVYDSRDPSGGEHGETVYDSFYRGRTFILNGQVEAGSLGVLKRLERDLKAAFAPLSESPMKFRWFDIFDSFDDLATLNNYTFVFSSSSEVQVAQGVLLLSPPNPLLMIRSADQRLFADSQQTLRIVPRSADSGSSAYLILKFKDASNYVYCSLSGNGSLTITAVVAGVNHQMATLSTAALSIGHPYWLKARIEGDLVTAECWLTSPQESVLPDFQTSAWLGGNDADVLGAQVLSQVGFGGAVTAQWALDDYRVESICPGDVVFPAKKLSALSMADTQTSRTRFKTPFQLTMRSSRFLAQGVQTRSTTLTPVSSGLQALGFSFPISFPLSFQRYVSSRAQQRLNVISVKNHGTVFTFPMIVVYGAFSAVTLQSLTNGQTITWSAPPAIANGDYLIFDCRAKTITNSAGQNMLSGAVPAPQWIALEPGWNDIYVGVYRGGVATRAVVYSRSGWL